MRFSSDNVKLTQIKQITTKNGRQMVFVRLLDEVDYSTGEFPLSSNCDVNTLVQLNNYKAVLDVDNGFSNVSLFSLSDNSKFK